MMARKQKIISASVSIFSLLMVLQLTKTVIQAESPPHDVSPLPSPRSSWMPESSQNICQNFYQTVCLKSAEIHDPTGTVRPDIEGEKLALHMYKEIIQQHRDWSVEQIDEALVQQIFTPKRRGRIEAAFRWVKASMISFIDHQPESVFTLNEKKHLKSRIQKTILQLPPPASIYMDEPDLLTKDEAYYERTSEGEMRLRVGGAYVFNAKSWFNLVDTLAHELAHSIDPCEIRSENLALPAYDRLSACFMYTGLIATRPNRSECGANDQLSETFADWVAAQIIADALALFSTEFHGQQIVNAARNSVRDLCEQDDGTTEPDLEHHPSPQIRIEKIFGENPAIRNLLGCTFPSPIRNTASVPAKPPMKYCAFDSEIPQPAPIKSVVPAPQLSTIPTNSTASNLIANPSPSPSSISESFPIVNTVPSPLMSAVPKEKL